MKRLDSFLNSNEKIKKTLKPDFLKMFLSSNFTLGGLGLIIVIVLANIFLNLSLTFLILPVILIVFGAVPALWSYHFTTYIITTEKILIETGFIGRDYDIIKLERVLDVNLDVTVLDTIFGTGCIKLCTANDNEPILLSNIKHPKEVIRTIQF